MSYCVLLFVFNQDRVLLLKKDYEVNKQTKIHLICNHCKKMKNRPLRVSILLKVARYT